MEMIVSNPDTYAKTGGRPVYATPRSAGLDLRANIDEPVVIPPGENRLIPTGVRIDPRRNDVAGELMSRSGHGRKKQLRLANSVGLIDSDYQGDIGAVLHNDSKKPVTIEPKERIAQLVIVPILQPNFKLVSEFSDETERGEGGFGHTGTQ
ncbi:dUTP diphosphatase [Ferrimonas marina]|uniref:dUTP diphosphatase n=1 Tax=Ferrimonas marina TaxID=299255 RepID=A0A1M5T715_9GAMM|nr:dUTP diphosphatase [Ferrimonas marina]SHH46504.1 dUTP pyrophosphatase [Ferrimonas marina]